MAEQGKTRSESVPTSIRVAGILVALEGGAGVVAAIVLIARGLLGADQSVASAYGTAAWFAFFGGAVLAAGAALLIGQRWGRAIAVIAQILLLPVSWALLTDSHQPLYGALVGVVVLAALVALFMPASSQWMAQDYGERPDAE